MQMSAGTGIAVAAIWLANLVLTLALIWMLFVNVSPDTFAPSEISPDMTITILLAGFLCALPMMVAYNITSKILKLE